MSYNNSSLNSMLFSNLHIFAGVLTKGTESENYLLGVCAQT